jgi:hypothetical protein
MEAIYNKEKYCAYSYFKEEGKRHIVETTHYARDFETLAVFKAFCKEQNLIVTYFPIGVAKPI